MFTWYLVLVAVTGLLGLAMGWWLRGAATERREYDAQIEAHEQVLATRRAPRHAVGQPRAWPVPLPAPLNVDGATAVSAEGGAATGAQRSTDRSPRVGTRPSPRPPRLVTTSADIAPVIVPQPGTRIPMHPQAARTSGDGTVTMPKLTDTGELRAMGDAIIAKIREGEIEWAHAFRERCEADRKEILP